MKKHVSDNNLKNYYGDERLLPYIKYNKKDNFICIYCPNEADSREHLPSKTFLDEPYPSELSIVPSCKQCNKSYSDNEQYLACLIDYVEYKSNNLEEPRRDKIKTTFQSRPNLKKILEKETEYNENDDLNCINYNIEKVEEIILKLSIGHAAYELNAIYLGEPKAVEHKFLIDLTEEEYDNFNSSVIMEVIPEIGSRAATEVHYTSDGLPIYIWQVVQDKQYRFLAFHYADTTRVRIVIGEFLYAQVIWE